LVAFCREYDLATSGSKETLAARIKEFLATGQRPAVEVIRTHSSSMPKIFTPDTIIGLGWRCSEPLRAFFEAEIGPQFHFNGMMRDFIKNGAGQTLQQAIEAWHHEKRQPPSEPEIAPQFEYNRHIRKFFKENPGQSLAEAIAAWNDQKSKRKTPDYNKERL
jgi:hypothetical protein